VSRFNTEFDFVHCLGKGGFGVVFEATNKMDECNYAIKRICLSNRVMREVRALAKLDHPGIVRYFNAWMETPPFEWKDMQKETKPIGNLYLYIQMQLCRRETLKDWLCANTLNRDRRTILDVFDQIVEAVDYVHSCGLMHRDLKPSNIFFSIDGAIKIGDFGLVTGVEKQNDEYIEQIGMTDKHTAEVGTQLYMSPEQVARATYDHKVDIFSMGMILFELFYPFSTQMERIRTLVNVKNLVFPERFQKEMPIEMKFVQWLLALKPLERPSTTQILDSELLEEFAVRRTASRFRNRTISGGSSSSVASP
ncbi:hypothetical protein LOTGIDRAFT_115590, partial [Lottia gigantea]